MSEKTVEGLLEAIGNAILNGTTATPHPEEWDVTIKTRPIARAITDYLGITEEMYRRLEEAAQDVLAFQGLRCVTPEDFAETDAEAEACRKSAGVFSLLLAASRGES